MTAGTALIVDDDADVALSARLLLRPLFAEVITAHDPAALPGAATAPMIPMSCCST